MVNASLAYEILMYFNSFYFGMFAFVELASIIYKTINLSPKDADSMSFIDLYVFIALLILETTRIYLGRKGSLSKHGWQVITSVVLTLPCIACMIYLIFFQKNTIKLEIVLCALQIILQCIELLYAIIFTFSACRPRTYT